MPELAVDRFAEFFQAIWGRIPFQWQKDLLSRVLENEDHPWPAVIALPTASGKTACLDVAVYALASQAGRSVSGQSRTAPRRVFFVVDRRLIVDEAFERARRLARKLEEAKTGIVREIADSLRNLAGGATPLACFQLRGGMFRSDAWARSPLQPIIVASTVDQLGSRLLFRAYGRSSRAWPIQAGLVGNDALLLLDEAHCAVPFMQTLQAVRHFRSWAERPLSPPFHVAIMSATPPERMDDIFRDTSQEPKTPEHPLGARQLAKKPSRLIQVSVSRLKALEEFAGRLARTAEELAGDSPAAVVIFANRVATAREVHRLLFKKHGERASLLTGRMRPIDKDDIIAGQLSMLSADISWERRLSAPHFVVATQTLEVGANLDFDLLVTECASMDALRQRFGRLNRMGRLTVASAAILIRADQAENSDDDPVYGPALANTWAWLNEQAGGEEQIDMGIASISERLPEGKEYARLSAPVQQSPVMLPAHLDSLVQTAPEPVPSPGISAFLHGPNQPGADVQVCWRADLDMESPDRALETLVLCPPAVSECLPTPIGLVRRWLMGDDPSDATIADVEGIPVDGEQAQKEDAKNLNRRAILWRGRDETDVIRDPSNVRPGDIIVLPAATEGWHCFGDLLARHGRMPVFDWGDRAHFAARGKATLRLHPSVLEQWPDFETRPALLELATHASADFEVDPDSLPSLLRNVLAMVAEDVSAGWLQPIAKILAADPALRKSVIPHPSGKGIIIVGRRRVPGVAESHDSFNDEDDSSSSGTVRVDLETHSDGVADFARRFATGCDLSPEIVGAMSCAGELHDLGKADPRFQTLLRGGNLWVRDKLLAKSGDMPKGYLAYLKARKMAGYPPGGRHELLSVSLAESAPGLLPKDAELRELVLHLIGSHHGFCRPFAPAIIDDKPETVSISYRSRTLAAQSNTGLERLESGVAERFWRLTRRYGWWGLAWLETIFRLADHRCSETEDEQGGNNDGSTHS